MKRLSADELDRQISFSYISYNGVDNVLDLPGPFSKEVDPTRFVNSFQELLSETFFRNLLPKPFSEIFFPELFFDI
jgi:hypothetical protein